MSSQSIPWPRLAEVRQTFPGTPVADLEAAVAEALAALQAAQRIRSGQRVAITAGSRGVANIVAVTAAAVRQVRALGAEPFVFPCMGSHGGATPAGQLEVLHSYGITPAAVGAAVLSQGEVVAVGRTVSGIPLWCDQLAHAADHLLVINRVKPHTDFSGPVESGPSKMLAIGLGKHHSAEDTHRRVVERGYPAVLQEVGDALWEALPVLGGIGLVENGHDQTVRVGAVRPASHEADERALLRYAYEVFGSLPCEFLHVLLVDWMGKNISGAGLDPNVTGIVTAKTHSAPPVPRILRVLVRGLTAESHGNGTGVGLADFILRRLYDEIDWEVTATNVLCGAAPESGRCPLVYATDQRMLHAASRTTGLTAPADLRLIRVHSTLAVDRLWASEALLPELMDHPRCQVLSDPQPMRFDATGMLPDLPNPLTHP
ncbi:MAG: hypothetical protein IT204_13710 [Fimbriimonadaceae bacterium]|nr:hypothetical protein [Fimbriimonadaceae bacterium]